MPDWVQIVHPSLGANQEPGLVTREAFDEVHKAAGWQLFKEPKLEIPVNESASKKRS